jgi:hypothetical protein
MKRLALPILALLLLTSCGQTKMAPTSDFATNPLVSGVAKATGLNFPKSAGGTGALLSLASTTLAPDDWKKVATAIPSTDALVTEGKTMGGITTPPTNLAGLSGAFKKIGISDNQVKTLVPAVCDGAEKIGGPEVGNLLRGALK